MMKTIADVIKTYGNQAVMVERHGSYVHGYLGKERENEEFAKIYSRILPDFLFCLDQTGIDLSHSQGQKLADWNIVPKEIRTSGQVRGAETGVWMNIGICDKTNKMVPMLHSKEVEMPIYHLAGLEKTIRDSNDIMVQQWLNGKRPDFCTETPDEFRTRVVKAIDIAFRDSGFILTTTHYEIVTLVHSLFVDGKDLGEVREDWQPTKNGGILLVKKRDKIIGFEYNPELEIV